MNPSPFTVERKGDDVQFVLLASAAAIAFFVRDHLSTPFDAEFEAAAQEWSVPSSLLRAIARIESSFNPGAVGQNRNGTRDYGVMQINERTFERFKVPSDKWLDPQTGIDTAARYLDELRQELRGRLSAFTWAAGYNVGPDLKPESAADSYGSRVLWHWQLYELGRLFA